MQLFSLVASALLQLHLAFAIPAAPAVDYSQYYSQCSLTCAELNLSVTSCVIGTSCVCTDATYLKAVAQCLYSMCGAADLARTASISGYICQNNFGTPMILSPQQLIDSGTPSGVSTGTPADLATMKAAPPTISATVFANPSTTFNLNSFITQDAAYSSSLNQYLSSLASIAATNTIAYASLLSSLTVGVATADPFSATANAVATNIPATATPTPTSSTTDSGGGGLSQSDKIALGCGISIPMVSIIIGLLAWCCPSPLKKRRMQYMGRA